MVAKHGTAVGIYHLKTTLFFLLLSTKVTATATLKAWQQYQATLSGRLQHDKIKN
jgi:hypothetical protein